MFYHVSGTGGHVSHREGHVSHRGGCPGVPSGGPGGVAAFGVPPGASRCLPVTPGAPQISLEHEILLHPRYFGPNLLNTVKQKLFTEVEGTCTGKYGFVIAVTTIDNIGAGVIQPGRGFVLYPVRYKAIVFRPFKGEVVDAVVTQVNKVGLFTEIGPMSCFISRHSIPSEMEFDPNSNPPCYKTVDEDIVIQQDDEIRLKIVGTRVDKNDITLYTYPENWRAFKALIAAQYSGARLRVASAPPHFHFGHTNRSPQFLQKFPLGKVPAFEGDDGFCVFESNAIAYYVSTEELRGSTPEAAAAVLQWVNFADSDVVPPASTWVFPTLGILHYNKQATEVAKEEVRRVLGVLDGHLRTRTFLVGERVSLADISLVCALLWLYKQVLDPAFRGPFGNVNRWFLTCLNQPQFKAVLGEVQLCQRMAQFDAKKFAESQARKEKDPPRKEKEKEKEPPRKEKPPKKEEKRPEPDEDLDECEQVLAAEPKAKDPFAHLPRGGTWGHLGQLGTPGGHLGTPGPFVLDEFKRKYSNEDTLSVALPHFWEHFDREGWSLWYCQYRYPEELSQTFMSCNLITGAVSFILIVLIIQILIQILVLIILILMIFIILILMIFIIQILILLILIPIPVSPHPHPSSPRGAQPDLRMFQRLDKLRKNAFASVALFGSDHDSSISGVWVLRGQELAFTLCPDWQVDYESYTWRKLDPDSAECRTLVTEYFLWEGEFRHVGKPFNQGKIFK
ncbi:hypothetical protein DUI87_33072 [Hirundo rustica rustica]|uniref:DNA-directed RNA polymerase II subunit RPB7 n=20 Tax=Passeriformes TaxID=9126 RepID=A0A3M0IM72_HIRRU|nr:hypothetical protein DUI87_33072 [Hirundo rustica rustica]